VLRMASSIGAMDRTPLHASSMARMGGRTEPPVSQQVLRDHSNNNNKT